VHELVKQKKGGTWLKKVPDSVKRNEAPGAKMGEWKTGWF